MNWVSPPRLGFVPKAGHKVDIPTCDVCGRLVDGFHQYENPDRQEWHLIAVCHGEVEEVVLSYEFLNATPQLGTGRAFVGPKRLAASEAPVIPVEGNDQERERP